MFYVLFPEMTFTQSVVVTVLIGLAMIFVWVGILIRSLRRLKERRANDYED